MTGCAAAAHFAATAISIAQQPSTSPAAPIPHTATLTVNARLIVLDVVVTDKSGRPVTDLKQNDFQVLEDGKQQNIRSFEQPSVHTLPLVSTAQGAATVFDPAQPASFGQAPVTILVLDQLNTHFADSSFARRELRSYLGGQPTMLSQPTALFTVYDRTFKQLSVFTRDRDVLIRTLEATPPQNAWQLEVNGKTEYGPLERLDQSLRALEQIAETTARVPGRKNVVWVGGGFPTIDPNLLKSKDSDEVKNTIRHVTDVLLDTRVTLYAVDPSSSAAGMTEITDSTQQAFALATGDASTGLSDTFDAAEDFDRLGRATGGRVVRSMNDVAAQIATAVDFGAQFYTLSYSPTSASQADSRYRKIKVVCLRPGLTLTTRDGYFNARTARENSSASITYDLSTAAESSVLLNGLRVTVDPGRSSPQSGMYAVHIGASGLTWNSHEDGSSSANVEVLAASLSSKGKMIGHTLHSVTATAKAGADLRDENKNVDISFQTESALKAVKIRFVVRDAATGRMGSIDLSLAKPE